MATHVLVVEDCVEQREMIQKGLSRSGYRVSGVGDAEQAMTMAQADPPDFFLIDLTLPGSDGFSFCAALKRNPQLAPVPRLIMSTDNTVETQVKGLQEYVDDYLTKPFDFQILLARMEALLRRSKFQKSRNMGPVFVNRASGAMNSHGLEDNLLGQCYAIRNVISTLKKFSNSEAPVLILGESGTGKELVARSIHMQSVRKNGSFVPINCGAIPENLIEAELFGHEKGAFTGAVSRKKGKVERAHRGTLFLDEVGDLSLSCQVKLLRFLEDFMVERIGGIRLAKVDVRVVAASNRNLSEEVALGRFREDLYYRLAVLSVQLPPLRERGDDKVVLAEEIFKTYVKDSDQHLKGFSRGALKAIRKYHWPGNVRQLINSIRRAIVNAENVWISAEDLGIEHEIKQSITKNGLSSLNEARRIVERNLVENALSQYSGNVSRAARELGVSRPTLYTLIKKHNLHA